MTGADRQTGSAWDREERVYKVSTATWYFLKIPFAKGTQSTDAPGALPGGMLGVSPGLKGQCGTWTLFWEKMGLPAKVGSNSDPPSVPGAE